MSQSNAPRLPRLRHLAFASVLGLALVGLTQCRNIMEPVTGVDLRTPGTLSSRSSCESRCNDRFKAGLIAEQLRYVKEKRACGRDSSCRKDVDRKHVQNLRDLVQEKKRCKRSCYNEGAGSGA